jgi:hypothetical protein
MQIATLSILQIYVPLTGFRPHLVSCLRIANTYDLLSTPITYRLRRLAHVKPTCSLCLCTTRNRGAGIRRRASSLSYR